MISKNQPDIEFSQNFHSDVGFLLSGDFSVCAQEFRTLLRCEFLTWVQPRGLEKFQKILRELENPHVNALCRMWMSLTRVAFEKRHFLINIIFTGDIFSPYPSSGQVDVPLEIYCKRDLLYPKRSSQNPYFIATFGRLRIITCEWVLLVFERTRIWRHQEIF